MKEDLSLPPLKLNCGTLIEEGQEYYVINENEPLLTIYDNNSVIGEGFKDYSACLEKIENQRQYSQVCNFEDLITSSDDIPPDVFIDNKEYNMSNHKQKKYIYENFL